MPFCKNCGRQLAENEVCNCAANTNPPPPPQVNFPNGAQGQPQQKKKSSALPIILAIAIPLIIVVLFVVGILAAILVPAMLGYSKKSKLQAMNSNSSNIMRSMNSAIAELDELDYDVYGYHIVCSEKKGNVSIPDFRGKEMDLSVLESKYKVYLNDSLDDYEWFAVIEDGCCTYAACAEKWHSNTVGTYPASYDIHDGPRFYDSSSKDPKADLQDLYDCAFAEIHKKN